MTVKKRQGDRPAGPSRFGLYLKMQGIQQGELARRLSISQSAINNWANNRSRPSEEMRRLVSRGLGVSEKALFGTPEVGPSPDFESVVRELLDHIRADDDSVFLLGKLLERWKTF